VRPLKIPQHGWHSSLEGGTWRFLVTQQQPPVTLWAAVLLHETACLPSGIDNCSHFVAAIMCGVNPSMQIAKPLGFQLVAC